MQFLTKFRQPLLALAVLAPVACTTVPSKPPELAFQVPERWQAQEQYHEFNWAELLQAPELQQLIEKALNNNSDLQATALKWQASQQQFKAAAGKSWPELEASFSGRRQEQNAQLSNQFNASLSVSWVLDIWGQLSDSKAAAFYSSRLQANLYRWARVSLASDVATHWLAAVEAKLQYQLAQSRQANLKTSYEVIYGGFQSGVNSALDVYSAKASWQNGQTNTQQRLQQLNQKLRQLAVLVGEYPDVQTQLPEALPSQLPPLPEKLQSNVLASRPDLQALSDQLNAQEMALGVARKNRLPRFVLSASYGSSSKELSELLTGDQMVWSLLGGITAPLFKGGQLKAEEERQSLLYQANVANYKQGALKAFLEVENYLEGEKLIRQQYQSTQKARENSDLALKQAKESYAAGLVSVTSLLQAERTAFDRQSQQLSLNSNLLQNRIRLYLALGTDLTGNNSLSELASNHEAQK